MSFDEIWRMRVAHYSWVSENLAAELLACCESPSFDWGL